VENLVRLAALLPCKHASHGGLLHGVDPVALFSGDFYDLAFSLTREATAGGGVHLALRTSVSSSTRSGSAGAEPVVRWRARDPAATTCFAAAETRVDASFPPEAASNRSRARCRDEKLFGAGERPFCTSTQALGPRERIADPGAALDALSEVAHDETGHLERVEHDNTGAGVYAQRYFTPTGPLAGALIVSVQDLDPAGGPKALVLTEDFPHWAAPDLARATLCPGVGAPDGGCASSGVDAAILEDEEMLFLTDLGLDRWGGKSVGPRTPGRTVSFRMPIPSNGSALTLSVPLRLGLLAFHELPPDNSRGLDLPEPVALVVRGAAAAAAPAAVAPWMRFFPPGGGGGVSGPGNPAAAELVVLSSVIIPLPIPDLSMPFNVIAVVSSVLAFFVGTTVNIVVRRGKKDSDAKKKKKEKEKEKRA